MPKHGRMIRMGVVTATIGLMLSTSVAWAGGRQETVSAPASAPERIVRSEAELAGAIRAELAALGIRTVDGSVNAIDFTLQTPAGSELSLSSYRGQFVFLNFWATWCPPCREEMPSMEVLHGLMADQPVSIVAVSIQEPESTVQRFLDEHPYTFDIALDRTGRTAAAYGVRGIPTSFFIAPDGTVVGVLVGIRHWDDTESVTAFNRIAALVRGEQ